MNLADLISRLGASEVARRLGVSTRTIRRWRRRGVPGARQSDVASTIARHLGSRKAWQTRLAAMRDQFPTPPAPVEDLLDPGSEPLDEVRPTKTPEEAGLTRYIGTRDRIESTRWVGTGYTIPVDQGAGDVNWGTLWEEVLAAWDGTGQPFGRIIVHGFKYVPFNPIYTGAMIAKQGTWDARIYSTNYQRLSGPLEGEFMALADIYTEMAESRVAWIDSITVETVQERF